MDWALLLLAGMMEWAWPVGLKYGWTDAGFRFWPIVGALLAMAGSGGFLLLAQRTIPMGTAYAVWTGIGAVGTFALGMILFKEPTQASRFLCVGLIIAGIIGLKCSAH